MKVEELKVDPTKAREVWRKYQEHVAYQKPYDAEIAAIYKRLAQGKTVIRALESIRAAGVNEEGYPRLAIARADEPRIECRVGPQRSEWRFEPAVNYHVRSHSRVLTVLIPEGSTPSKEWKTLATDVPLVPVHLRPKRGLQNYHILFEADWRVYPVDPFLLRRFGGDAWLVVAAWDLTPIERAVMVNRLHA